MESAWKRLFFPSLWPKALQAAADDYDGFCSKAYWTFTISHDTALYWPCEEHYQKKVVAERETKKKKTSVQKLWTKKEITASFQQWLHSNPLLHPGRAAAADPMHLSAFSVALLYSMHWVKPGFVCLLNWQRFIGDPRVLCYIWICHCPARLNLHNKSPGELPTPLCHALCFMLSSFL